MRFYFLMNILLRKRISVIFQMISNLFSIIKPLFYPSQIIIFQLKSILKKLEMQLQKSGNSPKRQYSRITLKIKVNLIRMVFRKSVPFDTAIQELGLKKTTALHIINRYKETGSLPMRKYRRTQKIKKEQFIIKKEEEQSIAEVLEEQMSPEVSRNNPPVLSEGLPYYAFNFFWMDYPMAFYCSY